MKCLVTGVAGFIGSTLADELVAQGHDVVGVDCFTEYYPKKFKERNLTSLRASDHFVFIECNLLDIDLRTEMNDTDYVFHLAAQPGVRAAWGSGFRAYVENNIITTQRLLETAKSASLRKFVYASSSSIYGQAESYPTPETVTPLPFSPYGTTKLAGENLCYSYHSNYGTPIILLRYFTVYGPRQRPDMAFARFIKSIGASEKITVFGDGSQTRDFTYAADAVHATVLAAQSDFPWGVFNVGGGSRTTMKDVIVLLEKLIGKPALKEFSDPQKGDVHDTCADISRAREMLGYRPSTTIEQGLAAEVKYFLDSA
jgi:UDP-glucose 4-epimerase